MERIKRALDRAAADREAMLREPAERVRTAAVVDLSNDGTVERFDKTGRFVLSRKLPVDAEALRRGRLLQPGMQGVAAQSFRMLRTQVMQRMRSRGWNTLAIVSATPGDGKTMVALNLALAISMDPGHSALLVDFDLRQPSVASRLAIPADPGVEECLISDRPVADVFVRLEGYDRLMLLPAGGPVVHSSELLGSEPTRNFVADLKSRYPDRFVLFDLPPLLGADDALAFLPQVDAVLMVIAEGRTRSEDLMRAFELIKDKPVVGTVLNQSRSDATTSYAY